MVTVMGIVGQGGIHGSCQSPNLLVCIRHQYYSMPAVLATYRSPAIFLGGKGNRPFWHAQLAGGAGILPAGVFSDIIFYPIDVLDL